MTKKLTHEEFVAKLAAVNPDVEVLGNYVDSKTIIPVQCKACGHEWEARPSDLMRSKGCPKCLHHIPDYLVGQRFGSLTVISKAKNKQERVAWLCRCDCGREKVVIGLDLKRGKTVSCGHAGCRPGRHKDLTGFRRGFIEAIEETDKRDYKGSVIWKCKCHRCGGSFELSADRIRHDSRMQSCGCYRDSKRHKVAVGDRFGRWVVIGQDSGKQGYWLCRCDCGTERSIPTGNLTRALTQSCGCLKSEVASATLGLKVGKIDGTQISRIVSSRARSTSKTGVRGVSPVKNGRYRAAIGFRGEHYYLGEYPSIEKAAEVRKKAEVIYKDFLENNIDEERLSGSLRELVEKYLG